MIRKAVAAATRTRQAVAAYTCIHEEILSSKYNDKKGRYNDKEGNPAATRTRQAVAAYTCTYEEILSSEIQRQERQWRRLQ